MNTMKDPSLGVGRLVLLDDLPAMAQCELVPQPLHLVDTAIDPKEMVPFLTTGRWLRDDEVRPKGIVRGLFSLTPKGFLDGSKHGSDSFAVGAHRVTPIALVNVIPLQKPFL